MTLEEQLLDKLVNTFEGKGRSIQSILDSQLFKDLPLDQKVKFINSYKDKLSQAPGFGWGKVGQGALGGALGGISAAMLAGAATGKINPAIFGRTVGMGALGGAGIGTFWASRDKMEDTHTSKSLDDAIQTIINRSLNAPRPAAGAPLAVQMLNRLKSV